MSTLYNNFNTHPHVFVVGGGPFGTFSKLVGLMLHQWLGVVQALGVVLPQGGPRQVVPSLGTLLRVVSGVWQQACEVGQGCLGCSLSCTCSVGHHPLTSQWRRTVGIRPYLKTIPSRLRSGIQTRSPGNGPLGCTTLCPSIVIGFHLIAICFLLLLY